MKTRMHKSKYYRGAQLLAALIIVLLSWPKAFAAPAFIASHAAMAHMHGPMNAHKQHADMVPQMVDCSAMLPNAIGGHADGCDKACDDLCGAQIMVLFDPVASFKVFAKETKINQAYALWHPFGGVIEERPPRHV